MIRSLLRFAMGKTAILEKWNHLSYLIGPTAFSSI
jgi:hypothetical protein